MGRAKLEKNKQAAIIEIKTKQNETLAKLNLQYQTADKAKKTFGYIGIITLSLLISIIILNDLGKLLNFIYVSWNEKRNNSNRDTNEKDIDEDEDDESIQIRVDPMYSRDLEVKLENVHYKLVKAIAANRRKENLF